VEETNDVKMRTSAMQPGTLSAPRAAYHCAALAAVTSAGAAVRRAQSSPRAMKLINVCVVLSGAVTRRHASSNAVILLVLLLVLLMLLSPSSVPTRSRVVDVHRLRWRG